MATVRATRLIVLAALASCNSVWGLDEARLEGHGGAGPGAGGAGSGAGTGTGGTGGTATSTSTTTAGPGGNGAGGGCVMSEGLLNGDFVFWSGSNPDDWLEQTYNCMVATSTLPSQTDGLSMALTTVGAGAYGGLYQTRSVLGWNGCVRLTGDSMKSTGTGSYHLSVTFNDEQLSLDLPGGGSFETSTATCRPSAPIDVFTARLRLDQVPQGGTVTYRTHSVHFDEVCCTGAEPACPKQ